jgi:hypothetical protein
MENKGEYAVVLTEPPVTTLQTVQIIQSLAPIVQASRMFGVTAEQAAVVMLKGHELGLGLATSFEFIHVIDGKPSVSPKGMMALIHNSGDVAVKVTRMPEDKAQPLIGYTCQMKRYSNGFEYTARFTLEDAKRAGLIKPNGGWEKYPENMCMWRAIGFAADVVCPDLGGGMSRPEELGAMVSADGEPVIDATSTAVIVESKPVTSEWTLQALVAKFGAEAVMAANDGRIPATDAEIAAIVGKLAEATNEAAS